MGETMGRSTNQVTPDFLVDSNDDGTVTFVLNHGNLPELRVSAQYEEMARAYKDNKASMNRREKGKPCSMRAKKWSARKDISRLSSSVAIRSFVTMKAIIAIQHRFFVDGDEADLRPMTLKDVADRTGLDISTISRVSNIKYARRAGARSHCASSLPKATRPIAEKNSPPATSKWRSRRS